jgi:hypothetical protein
MDYQTGTTNAIAGSWRNRFTTLESPMLVTISMFQSSGSKFNDNVKVEATASLAEVFVRQDCSACLTKRAISTNQACS